MKIFLIILFMMLTFEASSHAGWFISDDHEHEQHLEQQIQQVQHTNDNQAGVIVILGIGCIITLVVGTMIGSKTRRASNDQ